jgi:hypothetical protein
MSRLREPSSYLGARTAADLLGISPIKLQGLTLAGKLSHVISEPDKRPLWARSELEKFKAAQQSALIPAESPKRR